MGHRADVLARLHRDERHEPRGGGWSLRSNSLAFVREARTIIGYLLGVKYPDSFGYTRRNVASIGWWPALTNEMASWGLRGY